MQILKWSFIAVVYFAFAKANTLQAQQDFQAVAYFVAQTKFDVKPDTTKSVNPEQAALREKFREALSKGSQKEYKLEFTPMESRYEEEQQLAKPTTTNGSSVTISVSGGASSTIYKNMQEQEFIKEGEIFGKEFLIVDKLKNYAWQLSQETKKIGNYTCYKATYVPELTEAQKKAKEKKEEEKEAGGLFAQIEDKDRTITAWYTPDLPVSNGPGEYHGLPGMILEVKEKNTTLLCTKIEINPKENLKIKKPKGGTKISQEDFDALKKEKYDERMEMQGNKGFIITSEVIRN